MEIPLTRTKMLDDKQKLGQLEKKLHKALVENDLASLEKHIHENFVYSDEFGSTFTSFSSVQQKRDGILRLDAIVVLEQNLSYFENVAVVNQQEIRSGTLHGEPFETKYFASRIWKKNAKWHLLSVTLVKL